LPALVEALAAEGIPQLLARQINGVLKDGQPPERLDLAWASRVLSASEADRPKPSPGWPTGRTRFALATAGLTVAVACAGALRAAPAANSAAAERSPNGVLGQAQQAWKDGAREEALRILDVHLHENPQDGRAHLLRARIPTWADDAEREHYRQAARTLTELDDVSRALVDALEPAFAVPPDHQSALSRIEEKLKAAPESVDLLVAGSQMAVGAGAMRSAVALTERLLHLQPSFMPARYWHGYALAYENKEREAIAEFRRCIADRPAATTCRWALSELLANAGECNALRELSRDSIELATESPWPYWYAAKSVYEETGNLDALQAAFERLAAFPREGQLIESDDKVSLAVLQGNLAAARSEAERWYNEAATHSESRLGEAARVLGYVLLEQRDQDGLIRLTRDYEKRLAALKSDPRHDSQLLPAILLRRAHLMSASNFDARRTRWLETSDLRSRDAHADYLQWLIGYGLAVATPEDARVAVAEFERIARPADAFSLNQMLSYYVGHAYLSDGNPTAAKPYLARAVRACSTAQTPLEATWAIVDLAEVHLRTGAPGEACKLLKKTLLRWPSRFDTTRRAARLVEAAHCQSGP
jgi:predicted Zn-dependent protease